MPYCPTPHYVAILALMTVGILMSACRPTSRPPADEPLVMTATVRRLAPGGTTIAAYLVVRNQGTETDTLLGVTSPEAARVSIHHTDLHGDHATMVVQPRLVLPVGATVTMAPGGTHLMLEALTAPLPVGDSVTLHLAFHHAGMHTLRLPILGLGDDE